MEGREQTGDDLQRLGPMDGLVRSLRHRASARWTAMAIVAFTMLCGYFVADVASPLKPLIESELGWTSAEYGLYTSAYGWFNVFLAMLILGGVILDKAGARIAGTLACGLMLVGCVLNFWAMLPSTLDGVTWQGVKGAVWVAALGYAVFGVGLEMCGITATKVIARWFKGYELALAMGLQVAIARVGTGLALGLGAPIATALGKVSMPVLVGVALLAAGLLAYLLYCGMDRKLDASEPAERSKDEDRFRFADIGDILRSKGFWLLATLCAIFYSGVFPFLKYATDLMVQKFKMDEEVAGLIPALLPFGTMLLTPVFGRIYDKKGKGATMMVLGSALIFLVHLLLTVPILDHWAVALLAMLVLGVGFSLVPSAMWPSVPKIIPQRQLGTAYALIFWLQNLIALTLAPLLIGLVLDRFCVVERGPDGVRYDYTLPMGLFMLFGVLAVVVALMLKAEDRVRGHGLERPNQA